jgi:probable HAF family extracellular repeat protein
MNGFPDPLIVLGEFILSNNNDAEITSYESVDPNVILGPGTYFALFAPQTAEINDVGVLLSSASNPFDYQGEAIITIGTFDPSTGLPANNPPSLDRARIAVRILGIAPVSRLVSIDIRPGSDSNKLDPDSKKEMNVAILSVDGFDALTVKPTTVRFGAIGNGAAPVRAGRRDVDGNGKTDLLLRFEIQDTEIECGDNSAVLTGQTSNGESILGSGSINTVRCYTFETIDFPGGTLLTDASKLNDRGQIVGTYVDDSIHGFLLDDGLFATIDVPGSLRTIALGINNRRQIVGEYEDIVGRFRGFLWDNGVFTTIDVPGASETAVFDINDRGQMVGSYFDANGESHGFLLDKGIFITIDVPGSPDNQALGINNRGQIVGRTGFNGFLLDDGVFTTIKAPDAASFTSALDINNRGQIVGTHDVSPTGRLIGYVLTDGKFMSLDVPDAQQTVAVGINNRRQIVGHYTGQEGSFHGFLATKKTAPT